jgi:hypothetical protein
MERSKRGLHQKFSYRYFLKNTPVGQNKMGYSIVKQPLKRKAFDGAGIESQSIFSCVAHLYSYFLVHPEMPLIILKQFISLNESRHIVLLHCHSKSIVTIVGKTEFIIYF